MKSAGRIYFDITYTQTQLGSVGITRTVRRLEEEFKKIFRDDSSFVPVAFNSSGYRHVDAELHPQTAPSAPAVQNSFAARLLRWVSESFMRRLAFACLPLPLLHWLWRHHSSLTFDRLSQRGRAVIFERGDLLFLCDASWCCSAWQAARLARLQGASVVLMVYDLIPITHPEFSSALTTKIFSSWLPQMLRCSDAVVCISKTTEHDLRTYAGAVNLSLPPTGHFRLGSDIARSGVGSGCRTEISSFVGSSQPCFGVVGTIEPRKNHAWLIRVFEGLWARGHDVRLMIAGRPNAECYSLVRALKRHPEQGKRLLTVFDASDAEVAQIYASCRALLFPSLAEGFGLPLVEARTRGCPVIAGDLPVFAELADQGVFLFDMTSENALGELVMEHAKCDRRGQVGTMPPFLWADSALQLLDVTRGLVRERSSPAAVI